MELKMTNSKADIRSLTKSNEVHIFESVWQIFQEKGYYLSFASSLPSPIIGIVGPDKIANLRDTSKYLFEKYYNFLFRNLH
jgi:hypothetical protein